MSALKQQLLAQVEADLVEIENALHANLTPYLDLVSEVAGHILFSGGKRLRPLLMVLSARLCGYSGNHHATFATIFEYLHAATLLHDDLVDGGTIRRGKPVAHSVWGGPTAVLVGDFLLARSLSIASQTGNPKIIRIIAEITELMSQGEIQQLMRKKHLELTEEEYLQIIHSKTAVLLQGACRTGGLISGVAPPQEKALADYGKHLGLAFQMADDLLDYTSDTRVLGKAVGADLREGKLTLPLIHALKAASAADRASMVTVIHNEGFTWEDFDLLVDLLKRYGGLEYTRQTAAGHVARAKQALSLFDESPTRNTLFLIADYALARQG